MLWDAQVKLTVFCMCEEHTWLFTQAWVGYSRQNSNIAPKRFQPWYVQMVSQLNREIIQVNVIESHIPLSLCLEVTDGAVRQM